MASLLQNVHVSNRKGQILSENVLQDFKSSVKGQVLFKGEAEKEDYEASIQRYNNVFILEAVSTSLDEHEGHS